MPDTKYILLFFVLKKFIELNIHQIVLVYFH